MTHVDHFGFSKSVRIMNKIIAQRGNRVIDIPPLLWKRISWIRRDYSGEGKDDEKEVDEEELKKLRQGPAAQDKQQSLQEESYFHKEEREQLKQLKKKLQKKWKIDGKKEEKD